MVLSICGDKQGRVGQGRAGQGQGRAGQGRHPPTGPAGYIQDPWGKPKDLHLIKQKYNLKKFYFHYRTYLKNYNLFEKENRNKINK